MRDEAVVRVFFDTGLRRTELANLTLDDADVVSGLATVTGKGNKTRTVAFGNSNAVRSTAIYGAAPSTSTRRLGRCGSGASAR